MMKYILLLFLFYLPVNETFAQSRLFTFQWIEVPKKYKQILADEYTSKNCGAEHHVFNIGVREDVEFQNGVYWYSGMGPHFVHKVFVYYDEKLYILKGNVEFSSELMLEDYTRCVDSLGISSSDSAKYIKVINSAITGGDVTPLKKKKIKKARLNTCILEGEWFGQIYKRTSHDDTKISIGDFFCTAIKKEGNYYSISLVFPDDGTDVMLVSKLKVKKVFIYNNKTFLSLRAKTKDKHNVDVLLSRISILNDR